MRLINLLFEYDYDDVDVVLVPDYIAENIESVTQLYHKWTWEDKTHFGWKKAPDGHMYVECGTELFLWWLNNYFREYGESTLVEAHTKYVPEYPTADF